VPSCRDGKKRLDVARKVGQRLVTHLNGHSHWLGLVEAVSRLVGGVSRLVETRLFGGVARLLPGQIDGLEGRIIWIASPFPCEIPARPLPDRWVLWLLDLRLFGWLFIQ
jgi:hypothetical protein